MLADFPGGGANPINRCKFCCCCFLLVPEFCEKFFGIAFIVGQAIHDWDILIELFTSKVCLEKQFVIKVLETWQSGEQDS